MAAALLQIPRQHRRNSCRADRQIRDGAGRGQQVLISWLSSRLLVLLQLRLQLQRGLRKGGRQLCDGLRLGLWWSQRCWPTCGRNNQSLSVGQHLH